MMQTDSLENLLKEAMGFFLQKMFIPSGAEVSCLNFDLRDYILCFFSFSAVETLFLLRPRVSFTKSS